MPQKPEEIKKYGFANKQEEEFPQMVFVTTTNACNSTCIHCPVPKLMKKPTFKARFMDFELFKKITDEVAQYNSMLRIAPDGETFLVKDMDKMIEYAYNKEIKILTMNTNGSLMNEKILDIMVRKNDTKLICEVSLDALFKETYEKIRMKGVYEKILKNIFTFLELRKKRNIQNKKIVVSVIDQTEVLPELDLFKKFWGQIVDDVIVRKYVHSMGLLPKKNMKYNSKIKRWPCLLPWKRFIICEDGSVRFCIDDFRNESIIDSIKNKTIKEVWQGENYKKVRKYHLEGQFDKIKPCNHCIEWQNIDWDYNYQHAIDKLFKDKN